MPSTPSEASASRTSSSLKGLMTAMTAFIASILHFRIGGTNHSRCGQFDADHPDRQTPCQSERRHLVSGTARHRPIFRAMLERPPRDHSLGRVDGFGEDEHEAESDE